jgi:hypothetical protein
MNNKYRFWLKPVLTQIIGFFLGPSIQVRFFMC